jgi:glycerol-1-phosphate dehydrogenase [NAD(P)+]
MEQHSALAIELWPHWTISHIIENLMGKSFICPECHQNHSMKTNALIIKEHILDELSLHIEQLGLFGSCLVVFDQTTYGIVGPALLTALKPFNPRPYIFNQHNLHADAKAIGNVMIAMDQRPDFLVSCGSGTITDTVRYTSHITQIPFISFGTAASMDGYASSSTPLIVDGFKITYPGSAPVGIFADPTILANAPQAMTAAGFGDVLAKTIALIDWRLAHDIEGEPYCPLIASLVQKAISECVNLSQALANANPSACGKLMEVLSLTGIAMQMMGTSRPASGAEHHISHLLEMRDIQLHKSGSLHGDKVGIGTLISLFMYYELFGKGMPTQETTMDSATWHNEVRRVYGNLSEAAIQKNDSTPPQGELWDMQKIRLEAAMKNYGYAFVASIPELITSYKKMIETMGGPVYPHQLGYSVSDTYDAIAHGKEVRPKFTLLRIAERYGQLYKLADKISKGLPEGTIY